MQIIPTAVPQKSLDRHTYEAMRRLSAAVFATAVGLRNVDRGEAPSGGGTTISGGVTDHGALTGLTDDDHAQYLLLAGRVGGQELLSGDNTQPTLIFRGGSDTTKDIVRWRSTGTSYKYGAVQVRTGTPANLIVYTGAGTGISLKVGNPTGFGETYHGIDIYGESRRIQIIAAKLDWSTNTPAMLGLAASNWPNTIADTDDIIRMVRRSATQTGMALRLMDQSSTNTLASIDTNGAGIFTGSVGIAGTTSGKITLSAGATPGTYSLTLPAADAAYGGYLMSDGVGNLSWGAALDNPTSIYVSSLVINYDPFTGYGGEIYINGGAPSGTYQYNLPNGGGTIVVDANSTAYTLVLGTGSSARASSSSVGFSIRDNSVVSKVLRFQLSDCSNSTTQLLKFTGTASRTFTFQDKTGTVALIGDPVTLPYAAKTTTYAITTSDSVINCTSGTFTVTLPTAVGVQGRIYHIKNSGAGTITAATTSGQTIDTLTTQTIPPMGSMTVCSDNANWIII